MFHVQDNEMRGGAAGFPTRRVLGAPRSRRAAADGAASLLLPRRGHTRTVGIQRSRGRAVGAANPSAAGHLISPGLSHAICITRSPFQDGGSLALGLPLRAPTLAHIAAPPRHTFLLKTVPPENGFRSCHME